MLKPSNPRLIYSKLEKNNKISKTINDPLQSLKCDKITRSS